MNSNLQKFAEICARRGNLRSRNFFARCCQIRGKLRISLRAQNREFLGGVPNSSVRVLMNLHSQ